MFDLIKIGLLFIVALLKTFMKGNTSIIIKTRQNKGKKVGNSIEVMVTNSPKTTEITAHLAPLSCVGTCKKIVYNDSYSHLSNWPF